MRKRHPLDFRKISELKCPQCGKFLENTAAGNFSTCPDYHGGLWPKLSPLTRKRIRDFIQNEVIKLSLAGLKTGSLVRGGVEVDGVKRSLRCSRRLLSKRTAVRRIAEGKIIVKVGDRYAEIQPLPSEKEKAN